MKRILPGVFFGCFVFFACHVALGGFLTCTTYMANCALVPCAGGNSCSAVNSTAKTTTAAGQTKNSKAPLATQCAEKFTWWGIFPCSKNTGMCGGAQADLDCQ